MELPYAYVAINHCNVNHLGGALSFMVESMDTVEFLYFFIAVITMKLEL